MYSTSNDFQLKQYVFTDILTKANPDLIILNDIVSIKLYDAKGFPCHIEPYTKDIPIESIIALCYKPLLPLIPSNPRQSDKTIDVRSVSILLHHTYNFRYLRVSQEAHPDCDFDLP
jgi:hypothetical protein